ncbi:MAG: hypothetical protein NZ958_07710 [Bacteroidia bacterium]|nr:hypothetical protein [Bacteroidia bacterium]MDW8088632.1 hypothetical protein [Bacteroidia bacterium]
MRGGVATLWTVLAFVLSLIYALYRRGRGEGDWPFRAPDSAGYLEPILYYFKQGLYWPDDRLPGYGLLYGLGYALLRQERSAEWLLIILQLGLVLGTVYYSLYWLKLQGVPPLGRHFMGLAWTLGGLYGAQRWTDLLTDAPASALMVVTPLLLLQGYHGWAGVLFTLLFFLRPASLVLLLPILAYFTLQYVQESPRKAILRQVLAFLFPFLLAEGLWIGRNFQVHGDFRPLHGNRSLYKDAYHEPPWEFMRPLTERLGISSDSRFYFMLMGYEAPLPEALLHLTAARYLPPSEKNELVWLLAEIHATRGQPDSCFRYDSLRPQAQRLGLTLTRWQSTLFQLTHALVGYLIYENQTLSPLGWGKTFYKHPFYIASSFFFLTGFIGSLALVGLKGWRTANPAFWLLGGYALCLPFTHIALRILELRHLAICTPTLILFLVAGLVSRCPKV